MHFRKVQGESKDKAHGTGDGVFKGDSVPLRRWEDWERSRLRRLRREERRRKDFERAHPGRFAIGDGEMLSVFDSSRTYSSYEGSDTHSIASSEEDQWGMQIGGYNELNPAFPPPPVALFMPDSDRLIGATTLAGEELEAMLESGFDEPSPTQAGFISPGSAALHFPRYQLSDGYTAQGADANGYAPVNRSAGSPTRVGGHGYGMMDVMSQTSPTNGFGASSGIGTEQQTHTKRRSTGQREGYGPLGPLDPGSGRL